MNTPTLLRSYIGGEYVASTSGETFDNIDPATGRVICRVETAGCHFLHLIPYGLTVPATDRAVVEFIRIFREQFASREGQRFPRLSSTSRTVLVRGRSGPPFPG